jgi:hypothetical protein
MDLRSEIKIIGNEISRFDLSFFVAQYFISNLEMAMTLMNSYREKGYLVRRLVFVLSILLYNSMSNFTDHEFDKEGLIRKVSLGKYDDIYN